MLAMLVHVREEPGWRTVERSLSGSLMSAVNYSEVLKKSVEYGGSSVATANSEAPSTLVLSTSANIDRADRAWVCSNCRLSVVVPAAISWSRNFCDVSANACSAD